ncbi:MAG: trypsin-like peptidase domain-containing protein [Oscillospiraceae bacterium]|jgi:S1-C subfamily serine protease|nr:trypsin-like peptidase domain-containing protein [Oscillospiraceae bacterium]
MKSCKFRLIALIVAIIILVPAIPGAASEDNFSVFKSNISYANQFTDVPANAWYYNDVKVSFESGIVGGTTDSTYSPNSELTIAQALKMAAVIHSLYTTGKAGFVQGSPWYKCYSDYALVNGILSAEPADYNANITRTGFAQIFSKALPDEALPIINYISDDYIPDVLAADAFSSDVYKLYRAGILTGSDSIGSFKPDSNIKRSEVAAIVARMIDPALRKFISPGEKKLLTSTEISVLCSPAVFYIETYDYFNKIIGSGSGFFISSAGAAVTNYHVIDGAYSAKITTTDGIVHDVLGVQDYLDDEHGDIALIQVFGTNFTALNIGDSSAVKQGEKVYAIGSPLGLDNTMSDGIVSAPARTIYEGALPYIQISVPISAGSSGGALINEYGQVIGVTTAGFADGNNLNLATPIANLLTLKTKEITPLSTLFPPKTTAPKKVVHEKDFVGHPEFPGIPDLTKMTNLSGYFFYSGNLEDNEWDGHNKGIHIEELSEAAAIDLEKKFIDTLECNSFEYDPSMDISLSDIYDYRTWVCEDEGVTWMVSVCRLIPNGSTEWKVYLGFGSYYD